MEKVCEFCKALRPIVYCKSDAAHLCLFCDAKVHSANALSYRHPRTLVCESCRNRGANVRCFDHRMFLCRSCDAGLHHVSLQHKKRVISNYVGCPSAKDLTLLWGFDLNELEINTGVGRYDSGVVYSSIPKSLSNDDGSSRSRGKKVLKDENPCSILQQIVELERKLAEGIDVSRSVRVKESSDGSPFDYDANWKGHKTIGDHSEEKSGGNLDFKYMANPDKETAEESFSLTSAGGSPLHGESFWQCNNDSHNNEIWLQNMQDLGVCDQMQYYQEINIPDLDLSFRNFEELFGNEQGSGGALVDQKHSAGKVHSARASKTNDMSRHFSTAYVTRHSTEVPAEFYFSNQVNHLKTSDFGPRPPKLSYSTSFSVSRITGESTDSECKDGEVSPSSSKPQFPSGSFDWDNTRFNGKENVMKRFKEKKMLRHERQGQYASQKIHSDAKKMGKRSIFEGRMP